MKLKEIYNLVVKKGIEADPRGKKLISELLRQKKSYFDKLASKEKDLFDVESLFNPFADTRILYGKPDTNINSVIVGIDVDGSELLLVDRLREKGKSIDLVISHHPQGKAYANFYEVMDLQVDIFYQQGINLSLAEKSLAERKKEVERRVGTSNHQRSVDIAKILDINFMCIHTPADNLAYCYIEELVKKEKPRNLGQVVDLLLLCEEYKYAAKNNNPPKITVGNRDSRVSKIHIEFTGGTEGPEGIYRKLADEGVDTIIAMHQSEAHFKKCKEANINVVIASHIASDTLGMNLMLDFLEKKGRLKIYEFSGFRRVRRNR